MELIFPPYYSTNHHLCACVLESVCACMCVHVLLTIDEFLKSLIIIAYSELSTIHQPHSTASSSLAAFAIHKGASYLVSLTHTYTSISG